MARGGGAARALDERPRKADDPDVHLRAPDDHQAATGWGYETPIKEVSDSLHLRRFCLIGITERVPDKSTVRKLTRRLAPRPWRS
ncbi:MAG TPA: hypothetical protein VIY71_05435 [Solirubrobacterales bacterium]